LKKEVDKSLHCWYNNSRRKTQNQTCGGLAQLGERLHGMQEVSGSIPLFSTKKALYFVESMVLFFLLKPIFWGCIASPAPFSGFLQAVELRSPRFRTMEQSALLWNGGL
jgi:hypothetical protein